MGDFGSASAVDHAGFKGDWSDWAVLGAASWTWTRGRFEIEPFLGAGIARSTLDGDEMMVPRRELATVFETRLGIWGRWRYGPWTAALTFEVSALVATPTYTKASSGTVIYQVPSSALGLGGVIAVDLGR